MGPFLNKEQEYGAEGHWKDPQERIVGVGILNIGNGKTLTSTHT